MGKPGVWSSATPYLLYCVTAFSLGDLLFGIDTGSFGSLQALPSFLSRFGVEENGKYVLPTSRTSFMNSIVWVGKILGTTSFEPIAARFGYKWTAYAACAAQIIGVIIELTAKNFVQFSIGRTCAYYSTGLIENVVPSYASEVSPAGPRGFLAGVMTVLVSLGNVWGAGMSRAYAQESADKGWMIPTAVQLVPAVGMILTIPFAVESPRWLLSRGKDEESFKSLARLRPNPDVDNGVVDMEIQALKQTIVAHTHESKGSWFDLFRGNYPRRAYIVMSLFFFNQTTGNQFVNSYGPTFYKAMGLGAMSFTYAIVAQVVAAFASLMTVIACDYIGRRPLLIGGAAGSVLFNGLVAGLGGKKTPTKTEINTVIASMILLLSANKVAFQVNSFLISAEIGGRTMRKKFMGLGTTVDVIAAFLVTFCTPYLMNDNGAGLHARVGWIFGALSVYALIVCILFVPEFKGRSLEEVDELFDANLKAWQFNSAKTTGIGSRITQLEHGRHVDDIELGKHTETAVDDVDDKARQ